MIRRLTNEQATNLLLATIRHHTTYPQGQPVDITVTLTDEQWNAVGLAIQSTTIAASMDADDGLFPEWILHQMADAFSTIRTTVMNRFEPEFRAEIDQELRGLLDGQ